MSKPAKGLTSVVAAKLLAKHGYNELIDQQSRFLALRLLWHQLNSLLIYILVAAAIITYFLDHAIDTYVIAAVVVINTAIGFVQEYRASKAIAALKNIVVAKAKVYRDGQLVEIPSRELVVGDVVLLEEGDRVPADGRLLLAKNLTAVESSLTGEAFPVEKNTEPTADTVPLADRHDRVWMSTFVGAGVGEFEVTAIGQQTAIGQIASDLQEIKKEKTHFEIKTATLAKQMSVIAIAGAVAIFLLGFFVRDFTFAEIFTFSVAAMVSGIPEGLPAVIIIILATGASRMARKKAIVRSLPATETLSVVDVIATDKTGTLTQNTMTVKLAHAQGADFAVTGEGWYPEGEITWQDQALPANKRDSVEQLAWAAGLCSRARLLKQQDHYEVSGDPTEAALLVFAYKAGLRQRLEQVKVIDELPFDQQEKLKAVQVSYRGKQQIFISGAAESILARCQLSAAEKQQLLVRVEAAASQAMRVIALASAPVKNDTNKLQMKNLQRAEFLGFVGMIDPPRVGAKAAVARAQAADIRVVMKTGDHKATALAIALDLGIVQRAADGELPPVLTGAELEQLSKAEFKKVVERVSVFARLTPAMKLRILETLQKNGHTVAMTGDGVNDVLALKKADIGIAMGRIGTDVAREASDIVLADDNFASLIDAVEEGRIIFANTRQASAFLVTTNFAEHAIILLAMLVGFPLPLIAAQILWLNLVTDGVVDVALAAEPGHGDVLKQKPKTKGERILSRKMLGLLLPVVVAMVASSFLVFWWLLPDGLEKARTAAFCVMCFTQLFNIFNMRSLDLSIFEIGWLSNKYIVAAVALSLFLQYTAMTNDWLMGIFQFVPLKWEEVLVIGALSSSVLLVGEGYKILSNKSLS